MTNYENVNWGDAVTAQLADLSNTKEKLATKKFEKKEVDLTKYFTTQLGDKEKTGQRIFRILPDPENPFEFKKKVYFHQVQLGKEWKKLYDPTQNGTVTSKTVDGVTTPVISPLNDARKVLNASPNEALRKSAMKFKPRLFYIIRGIDRQKEHEGVKFWRFAASGKSDGAMDKIEGLINIYNATGAGKGAFWNPGPGGRDLYISLAKDESNGYTKITNMIVGDPTPLHTNAETAQAWLNDTTKWEDVYKTDYPMEYLMIVAEGSIPEWDKEKGGYVAKNDDRATPASTKAYAPAPQAMAPTTSSMMEGEENVVLDDLPF